MKIVVAGGRDDADFLIGLLLMGKHKLITVNEDMSYCEHLAAVHDDISVIYGDPCKEYVMEDAGIRGCDIVIALREKDADNLEICQMAKRLFAVKKTVCTVRNPKNVEIFELLGVDRAISATYMLAHYIEQASVVEDLVKVMPLENQRVLVNEIRVMSDCPAVGRKIPGRPAHAERRPPHCRLYGNRDDSGRDHHDAAFVYPFLLSGGNRAGAVLCGARSLRHTGRILNEPCPAGQKGRKAGKKSGDDRGAGNLDHRYICDGHAFRSYGKLHGDAGRV